MPNAQDGFTRVKLLYYHHQEIFKTKVWELKTLHWQRFLADKGPEHAYQAYKFTKGQTTSKISALKDPEGHLITEVAEKATILFNGTSLIPTVADLSDIPAAPPLQFPPITNHEIHSAIRKLPNRKAAGPDKIPNKLLKIAKSTITPTSWKASKDDYTDPNAYQPIALLSTLGKLFEKIINNRPVYWAEQSNALHQGHVGGRPGRCINDALTMLSTWVHHKWREKKVVIGIFLDVKSAYPTVYKERLIHSLRTKDCPTYLCLIITSFLTDRTMRLRLGQYISQCFPIPNGLPQGSPLLVTLYLLYNSNLLLPGRPSLDKNTISIMYIDNLTHLITGLKLLEEVYQHSQCWRLKHGAIFDSRKTNVMVFTKKKINQSLVQLENQSLTFEKKIKWLGITLTPGEHLKQVKRSFNTTFTQLTQITRPTFGLNQKESRQLISVVLLTQILHGSIMWTMKKKQ
ncbi:hypothetical protein O181_031896 [Austropuccinia psidii MF-1]|uniref:Reverse transcriptase domain-containing protein n=1 Tax=Austropuccinia psidii MF-1 TaxID=1389203 RepID=A0A9Q3CVS3_9BASI|nr:hypothetical protein [Austropuccinia psidii MF-1]